MDTWLDAGADAGVLDRQSLLRTGAPCFVTTCTADGAQRMRTARIDSVSASGTTLLVRLSGSDLEHELIPNPRVTVAAWPAAGGTSLTVVHGLARIHSRVISGAERDLSLVEITIQRVECWPQQAELPLAAMGPAA